jgi:hypothetical protein
MRRRFPTERAAWTASVAEWHEANRDRVVISRVECAEAERVVQLSPLQPWSRLNDDERDRVHELLDRYAGEHSERRDAHICRIEQTAYRLGLEVAAHERTITDAVRILDEVEHRLDDTYVVAVALVPHHLAEAIAEAAYTRGLNAGRRVG